MKNLCIIPARGGSKRFPNKNITNLNGKPLIKHTIDTVIDLFDTIIVSTDSDSILQVVSFYENIIPIVRPDFLATDTSKVLQTVEWHFNKFPNGEFDQIWLCLPTCPLRSKEDVINSQKLLTKNVDSVISITDFEFPPTLSLIKNDNNFIFENNPDKPFSNGNTRSQDHKPIFRPNGAIYGSWWKSFAMFKNFFKGIVKGYYMPRERSVDIDNKIDLQLAELILKNM